MRAVALTSTTMASAAHADLHLLKSTLRTIHQTLADFSPPAARPPILDSSTPAGDDAADDAHWLKPEPLPGLKQLREAIKIDLDLLERFLDDPVSAHLPALSTNASYLTAVYDELLDAPPPVVAVFRTFAPAPVDQKTKAKATPVKVDIVADGGRRWIRVNTTKNSRLMAEFRELDSYLTDSDSEDDDSAHGPSLAQTELDNSVLRMGRALIAASNVHTQAGAVPTVTLRLTRLVPSGADPRIAQTLASLRAMGLDVQLGSKEMPPTPAPASAPPPPPVEPPPLLPTAHINLDLSVLIALVSDLTHAPLPRSPAGAVRRFATDPSHDAVAHARALSSQIMQEMRQEMAGGAFFDVLKAHLPAGPVGFWTTREARARFERIVGKIGGPGEKRRAGALFTAEGDGAADAEARFWEGSRYAPGFVPLLPVHIYADDDDSAPPCTDAPFFSALADTCRDILAQGADAPAPPATQYSNNGFPRETVAAPRTRVARLTAHTAQSVKEGAARGWTTLTANRTSLRALLREMRGRAGAVGADGQQEGVEAGDGGQEQGAREGKAALWLVDPRSLAEGARERAEASYAAAAANGTA
ncbi:hypothetical protein B0H15DRAFT_882348 [Mycena belliarum]|uniref:DUF1308 domain-containing protein n=1 Tax=Mycena belliarum TaxID=1033014 RepID=A0AAD6U9D9_9AGAR|nr:hypothetical protein B0H15DRAFT_882348 [Mycena belliae]